MATRYWVGGSGEWNPSDTSHWSTSSGGSSGASVPGASDTAIFNASSGGGTITFNSAPGIASFNSSGFGGDFSAGGASVRIVTSGGTVTLGSDLFGLTIDAGVTTTLVSGGYSTPNLTLNGGITCSDAMLSASVVLGSSGSLTLKSGATSTIGIISWPASAGAVINSSTPGSQATLSDPSGSNTVNNTAVTDIAFSGSATWYWGTGYTDGGNNTGISAAPAAALPNILFGAIA